MTSMILADGTIGQMMEPISFEDAEVETYEKPWALTGTKCARKHNIVNSLYLKPDELEKKNFERFERYKIVEENEPMWEEYMMEDAEYCVVAFGIASRVAKNAVVAARKEGIKVGLIRPITLWPFPKEALRKAADQVKSFVCVELNMGQMIEDVRLYTESKKPVTLCNRCGGMIPSPEEVLESIRNAQKGEF
jgi:2-oxoglutarate ferredoxin oxidoreductase subunit alpha